MKIFITGTDTEVGKTYVSSQILQLMQNHGRSTLGVKPVASGCDKKDGALINSDAQLLQTYSSIKLDYCKINPFAFEPAIAPHIAAGLIGQELSVAAIVEQLQPALHQSVDLCLIEGVGGWYCPLNFNETMADLVKILRLKTIMVVGVRLGGLNHALLTYEAIIKSNVPLLGWIANCVNLDMPYLAENIATLKNLLPAPCLSIVDFNGTFSNPNLLMSQFSFHSLA